MATWTDYKNHVRKTNPKIGKDLDEVEAVSQRDHADLCDPPHSSVASMENEKIVRTVIRTGQQPTEAQIQEIEKASFTPVVPDEDAPELILEQYAEIVAVAKSRHSYRV